MKHKQIWLMGSASGLMLVAVVSTLISAQWKHESVPFLAFCAILILTIVKARWVMLDFMGLRETRPMLSMAILAWPMLFSAAALAEAALSTLVG